MRIGSFTLAVVGVVAAAATLALNTFQPASINLHSHSHSVQVADDFDAYISEYGKSYESKEEYEFRKAQFNKAKQEIATLNSQNSDATFGFNKFSDWTEEEYQQLLGYRADIEREHIHSQTLDESVVNGPIDWRAQGKVNAVKNQASCGSCWAFSAVSAMESAHAIKTGSLVRMSEQMVVDCSRSNYGCQGGWYYTAWSDVQKLGGVPTESSYPYTGRDGACKKSTPVANVTGSKKIRANDPEQIKAALTTGPVSIALSAGNRAFQSYTGGIWNGAGCGTQLDHAVITVGWGSQGGQDYFIVRNSWGATWGDRGYIHLQAQSGRGPCGMNSEPWQVSTN